MMTEKRLRQLCDFVELLDKHEIDAEAAKMGHEMLDEIKRLKADHDANVTRWTIFLAEQRAEIERLRRQLDEATTDRDAWGIG